MCGIAGQFSKSGNPVNEPLLRKMSKRLVHRGPDGEGFFSDDHVGLIHRRLAIIDLSDDAAQPMTNEDKNLWLVFNGEIYNYLELIDELKKYGHTFSSHSDTEVILHAYEQWGVDCLKKFNGMWAFALWDKKNQMLFCARDRLGIKPLYYAVFDGAFFFASEIKALNEHEHIGKKPNNPKVLEFLAWGAADHSQETMFEGVFQVNPAHYILVTEKKEIIQKKYWDLSVNPAFFTKKQDDAGSAQRFMAILRDAVNVHLRSDVPIGTCLSGGLDSSTLTVLINEQNARHSKDPVTGRQNTFSACFVDERFDESAFIDIIVKKTGVSSYKTMPDGRAVLDDVQNLLYMNDEPFAALTLYSQYCVMREASRQVKVVLDGQGADEILAGYIAYQYCHIMGLTKKWHLFTVLEELAGTVTHHRDFLKYFIQQVFARKSRRSLLKGEVLPFYRYRGSLDQALHEDLISKNLPYLLHWEDRTSMAFSLEARVPYLDYRLVEFVASLPQDQKIRNGITKFVLRKAINGLVPEKIRCRMDKKGFSTPEEVWMKNELREEMVTLFHSESFQTRPYWDAGAVMQDYQKFLDGKIAYSSELWRFACVELWLRMFIDAPSATGMST
ncbi:MAG: asparagine synthase (glutamine-hydrolyzing) [Methanoregula sp.]|jgi:asparagine synthase (glutamine-hydrolysing)